MLSHRSKAANWKVAQQLKWSAEAIKDVKHVASYQERDSVNYAIADASQIIPLTETIPKHTELGRLVPEINDPGFCERNDFGQSYPQKNMVYR